MLHASHAEMGVRVYPAGPGLWQSWRLEQVALYFFDRCEWQEEAVIFDSCAVPFSGMVSLPDHTQLEFCE